MRRGWLVFGAVMGVVLAVGVIGWGRRSHRMAMVADALGATPAVDAWPLEYAVRVRALVAAIPRLRDPVPAWAELAALCHANGAYPAALRIEAALSAWQPREPRWQAWRADAAQKAGDMAAAETALNQALALVPADPALRWQRAEWRLKHGDLAGAEQDYRARLAAAPSDPYAAFGLARVALQRGERQAAVAALEQVVAAAPDFAPAHNLLAAAYAQDGDERRAEQERARGTAAGRYREPDDPWLAGLDAWSFDPFLRQQPGAADRRRAALRTAQAVYREARRVLPQDPDVNAALAYVEAGAAATTADGAERGSADPMTRGRQVYLAVCFACHQPDGQGLPGVFPPLANSDYLQADKARAIAAPVHGLSEPIIVNGRSYHAVMPPQTQLGSDALAAVMTYVGNSWGNHLGPVTAADIDAARRAAR